MPPPWSLSSALALLSAALLLLYLADGLDCNTFAWLAAGLQVAQLAVAAAAAA